MWIGKDKQQQQQESIKVYAYMHNLHIPITPRSKYITQLYTNRND